MGRLVIAVAADVGVSPAGLAAAWEADEQARAVGRAGVEAAPRGEFVFDVVVAIPLAVNVASTAVSALVGRLVARMRGPGRISPRSSWPR